MVPLTSTGCRRSGLCPGRVQRDGRRAMRGLDRGIAVRAATETEVPMKLEQADTALTFVHA